MFRFIADFNRVYNRSRAFRRIYLFPVAAFALLNGFCSSSVHAQNAGGDPNTNTEDTNITQSGDLWYFGLDSKSNNIKPANYNYQVTLTDTADTSGTFVWTIIQGADKVDLYDGTSRANSVTISGKNTVTLWSKAPSASGASVVQDVTVQLSLNGKVNGTFSTTVFAPSSLTFLYNVDNAAGTNGYKSEVHYSILDQFGEVLSKNVEINEDWQATVNDIPGNGWQYRNTFNGVQTLNGEGSTTANPSNWYDNLTRIGEQNPTSLPPQNPLLGTLVNHWAGQWRVGSLYTQDGPNNNYGIPVRSLTWHIFRDHGRN